MMIMTTQVGLILNLWNAFFSKCISHIYYLQLSNIMADRSKPHVFIDCELRRIHKSILKWQS